METNLSLENYKHLQKNNKKMVDARVKTSTLQTILTISKVNNEK